MAIDVDIEARLAALLDNCEDSARLMTHCAAQAEHMELQLLLTQRVATWQRWAGELAAQRSAVLASPLARVSGARAAVDLVDQSDSALLAACEQREARALRMYRQTLEEDIPRILRAVLVRHVEGIHNSRARMRRLHMDAPLAHV